MSACLPACLSVRMCLCVCVWAHTQDNAFADSIHEFYVHLNQYTRTYVGTYVRTYIHTYIHACVYIYTHSVYVYTCKHVCIYMCLLCSASYVCKSLRVYIYIYAHMNIGINVNASICVYIYVYMCMYIYIYMSIGTYNIYIYIYMCINTYIYVYVYIGKGPRASRYPIARQLGLKDNIDDGCWELIPNDEVSGLCGTLGELHWLQVQALIRAGHFQLVQTPIARMPKGSSYSSMMAPGPTSIPGIVYQPYFHHGRNGSRYLITSQSPEWTFFRGL